MRRRRVSPYSQVRVLQRSRQDLAALILLTIGLGLALNLLATLVGEDLKARVPWQGVRYLVVALPTLLLAGLVVVLFYSAAETSWVPMEIQIPYHLPGKGRPEILLRGSYGVTHRARQAFGRRYREGTPELEQWQGAWRQATGARIRFQDFFAEDHAALVQCLLLYTLHRYGEASLGDEACFGWFKSDLPAVKLGLEDLPADLADNPFLKAEQGTTWRLLLPQGVRLELLPENEEELPFRRWRLQHRRYGCVEIHWYPYLAVASKRSQPYRVLTQDQGLGPHSRVYVLATRLEARASLHWTLLRGADAFHDWAAGLLCYLEEALDWGYYLNTRSDRLVAQIDEHMGRVHNGASLFDRLEQLEKQLRSLERKDSRAGENGAATPRGE